MLSVTYCYAECYYAEYYYAECYYAECQYAECRGTVLQMPRLNRMICTPMHIFGGNVIKYILLKFTISWSIL
jgi:hypothetical protein